MSPALPLVLVFAMVVLLASLRLWRQRGHTRARRSLLLALQALSALLLYFALLPPSLPGQAGTLRILTAGARAVASGQAPADTVIALPEAEPRQGVEQAPDLATALRRHPGTQRLQIIGAGLEPRDLEVAAALPLQFEPPPPTRGWVMLQPPPAVAPGAHFSVAARALGIENGQAELLDPAGRRVDVAALDSSGHVRLHGSARAAGETLFSLRLLDGERQPVETLPVPLQVVGTAAPRIWLLASAPGAELKYLRRWADDAGLLLHTQMAVGGGLQLGDAPRTLDAGTLAATDLLVLDERSLSSLGAPQRVAVRDAVDGGLGLLVRLGGSVPDASRAVLREFGLAMHGSNEFIRINLDTQPKDAAIRAARRGRVDAAQTAGDNDDAAPLLERPGVDADAAQSIALLKDVDGKPLGSWTAYGRGRVGVLPLSDSFSWVLAGHADLHGELWSQVFAALARPLPSPTPTPALPALAWADERVTLCALGNDARVLAADGRQHALQIDPATGHRACAAYWPQQAGWHRVQQGEQLSAFHVMEPDQAQPMRRYRQREATLRLRSDAVGVQPNNAATSRPGPRWPWLLGFLFCASLLWWLERRRGNQATG